MQSEQLKTHSISLVSPHLRLRPMTEGDWPILLEWNSDSAVLYFSEGDDVQSRSLEEIQEIYRYVSEHAFCFIVERGHEPIGECWLQDMNLPRILAANPGRDCRRIDLMIGEKHHWSRGYGTEIIRTLLRLAFEEQDADMVFGCEVADYNKRSRGAFSKAGFCQLQANTEPPGRKAKMTYDFRITRQEYREIRQTALG
jgi:RimJ/RimL family protein N-acetyltransferase